MPDIRTAARVDTLLTNVSQKQKVEGVVADEVLTAIQVVKSSDLIGSYGKGNLRVEHDIVGGNTPYPRITVSTKSSDRYSIEKHGLSVVVTEEEYANEMQPFDAEKDAAEDLTDKLALGKERALAASLTSTSVITNNVTLSGTDQYDDYANSDPLGDFNIARQSIYENSGQIVDSPNGFGICPWQVANVLKYHPAIIDLVGNDRDKSKGVTMDQLANAMGVGRLLIPWAQYDPTKEGQIPAPVPAWGNHIVFGYAPKQGSKKIKTLGFKVQRNKPRRVFKNRVLNPPNANEILVDDSYDFLLTDVGAAYLIKDAI